MNSVNPVTVSWDGPWVNSGGDTQNPEVCSPGVYTMTVTDLVTGCTAVYAVIVTENTAEPLAEIPGPEFESQQLHQYWNFGSSVARSEMRWHTAVNSVPLNLN